MRFIRDENLLAYWTEGMPVTLQSWQKYTPCVLYNSWVLWFFLHTYFKVIHILLIRYFVPFFIILTEGELLLDPQPPKETI